MSATAHASAARSILVTGAGGQVGHELVRELAPLGAVVGVTSKEADLTDLDAVRNVVRRVQPAAIVNAAAYTAVDAAESDEARARAVNALAPGALADEARRLRAPFVHFSTDYVFDGAGTRPYTETDAVCPVSAYGRTKAEGEARVAAAGGAWLTFRTGWVYGRRGRNFMLTMLAAARARDELRVVADQRGAPTWSRMIAAATAHVLAVAFAAPGGAYAALESAAGLYHLAAGGETTWHGFAEAILAGDPRSSEQRCRAVRPITTAEYPTPARRPPYSVLDSSKAAARFGVRLPHWTEQLRLATQE